MKDLWIFVDELQAITARQRNCFSCSIIDANRMQDSLKNLMKMENKQLAWKYIWNDTKIVVVVVVVSCTILLFTTIGRVIIIV